MKNYLSILFLFLWAFFCYGADIKYKGVNLAGAEFGESELPGVYGSHYIYPTQTEVDYFQAKGMNLVRLPFRWERLQQTTNAAFDPAEFNRLHSFVSSTTAKGMFVILDPHNYARYRENVIGSASLPIGAFTNFWGRLASVYKTNSQVIFGLMNEPNTMSSETWRDAANAAIIAIRNAGATNLVLVPGNGWSGAFSWNQNWYGTPNATLMLTITDPKNNFAFEVHQYLDADSSGRSSSCVSPTIGVERLADFTAWCRSNGRRGFLGEFAGSVNADCQTAVSNMLATVEANSDVWLGWAWWAAGPWWGEYMFTLEPSGSTDRPQMNTLENYLPILQPDLVLSSQTQFQFHALPGLVYQPQQSTSMMPGSWSNYGSAVTGSNQTATVNMTVGGAANRYHRVEVHRAP